MSPRGLTIDHDGVLPGHPRGRRHRPIGERLVGAAGSGTSALRTGSDRADGRLDSRAWHVLAAERGEATDSVETTGAPAGLGGVAIVMTMTQDGRHGDRGRRRREVWRVGSRRGWRHISHVWGELAAVASAEAVDSVVVAIPVTGSSGAGNRPISWALGSAGTQRSDWDQDA